MNPSNLLRKIIKDKVSIRFGPYPLDIPYGIKEIFLKRSDVGDELTIRGKVVIITKIEDQEIYVINKTLKFLTRGNKLH